jgi:hypothetical protein
METFLMTDADLNKGVPALPNLGAAADALDNAEHSQTTPNLAAWRSFAWWKTANKT